MSRRTSNIWQYCTVLDKTHARCGLCKQKLSYKSSITNIKRHLARKHPDVCQYLVGSQYQVAETIEIKPSTSDSEGAYENTFEDSENPQNTSDLGVEGHTEVVTTACGSFHIIPKAASDVENNELAGPVEEMATPPPKRESKKQKTSNIWQHCTPIDKVYARCNICEAVLSYRTSITNIKKHLVRKHNFDYPACQLNKFVPKKTVIVYENDNENDESTPDVSMEITESKVEIAPEQGSPGFLHTYSRRKDPLMNQKNRLDNKLLDIFIKDYQPFRIVDEMGFRSFVKALNPSFIIPSRQQIIKSLSSTYGKCLAEMKDLAQGIKECCLTTECWTSELNETFLTVTVHFIDEEFTMKSILLECISIHSATNIAKELQRITEEWGIAQKILLAVSDNDANVQQAMVDLQWNHFGCFAHIINSLVQDAITLVESLLERMRSVIIHFKTNAEANTKLEMYQKNIDTSVKTKKLLQEDGRWISSLRMLERFVELEDAIKEISLLYQDINLPQLTCDEWMMIHELCQVLKPFETVANFISSQKYTSASLVIVLTKELDDALEEMLLNNFSTLINELLVRVKNGLSESLGNVETIETLALCTYLDPRFKNLGFSSVEAADATKDHLVELLSSKIPEQNATSHIKTEAGVESSFSIWQSFKKRVSECKQPCTSKSRAIIEVERYLEDELMDQHKNPLEWWREYKGIYPCMSIVAQEIMCALGTSVQSDRIFSKGGYALTVRRNCLNSEEIKILTFLNSNLELFGKRITEG